MAFPPTSDLLDSANAGVRFFEVEDSLGSRTLVRRQLTVADAAVLEALKEGDWVVPDPANINQYLPADAPAPGGVAYVVASMTGTQGDVKESGGVTGLAGSYVGRTKVFDAVACAAVVPGDLLTTDDMTIGGVTRYGLTVTGATATTAVARVEFLDSANGVLVFTALPR